MLPSMTDRRSALFQAILDQPGDDGPRHSYADDCVGAGDPYGLFIRAQLAQTHALRHGKNAEAEQHEDEARKIQASHPQAAADWTGDVEKLVTHAKLIRGFVDKVLVEARRYLDNASELHKRAPIRQLVLTDVGELAAEVAQHPLVANVAALSFTGKLPIGDTGLAAIASSPHLRNLRVLEISRQQITKDGLDALCKSATLPSLAYVALAGNQFPDPRETYTNDWATRTIVAESIALPELGKQLEAKYGELPWLHAPSRLSNCPPSDEEV